MPRFVTIGNLTIDELTFPDGRHQAEQCGGNALYAAVGVRIWGGAVGILSLAGLDYPRAWLDTVRDAGIDVTGVADLPQPHGMRAGLAYSEDGERTILENGRTGRKEADRTSDELRVWLDHSPRPEHLPASYADVLGVHLAPMPVQAHARLVSALRQPGRRITVDSPWWDPLDAHRTPDLSLLIALDALLPSEAEVQAYFGGPIDPVMAARTLGRLGPGAVVIKLGARGSIVYTAATDSVMRVPAFPSHVVDPTGAGDSFGGGFLVGLTETGDPVEAARYGTVAASFVIEGYGAHHALHVTRRAAEERLRALVPEPL